MWEENTAVKTFDTNNISEFERELINRFFDPKSYFLNGFISYLKSEPGNPQEPLDAVSVAMIVDEIIQAPDKIAKIRELDQFPRFRFYEDQLFQSIEILKGGRLSTQQMMEIVGGLGKSLAETLLDMVKDPDSKQKLLISLDLIDSTVTSVESKSDKKPELQISAEQADAADSPEQEEFYQQVDETQAQPPEDSLHSKLISQINAPSTEEEAKLSDSEWEFWEFFKNDREEKIANLKKQLQKLEENPENYKLFARIKNEFRDLRDWSMIQGEQGIEAISHKVLLLFETVLRKDLTKRNVIIPILIDSAETMAQMTAFGWGNENLDIAQIMVDQIERQRKLYPQPLGAEPVPEQERQQEAVDSSGTLEEELKSILSEIAEPPDDPVEGLEEGQESQGDEFVDAVEESILEGELGADSDSFLAVEDSEQESHPEFADELLSEEGPDNAQENLTIDQIPEDVGQSSEKDEEDSFASIEDTPLDEWTEEIAASGSFEESETAIYSRENSSSEDLFTTIRESEILSELVSEHGDLFEEEELESEDSENGMPEQTDRLEDSFSQSSAEEFKLPGEDDEELQEILAQLQEDQMLTPIEGTNDSEAEEDLNEAPEEAASAESAYLQQEDMDWETWSNLDSSGKDSHLSSEQHDILEPLENPTGDGSDLIAEADMYFIFARKALQQLMKNASDVQALEDMELACYSLKVLGNKLGYSTVAGILESAEGLVHNVITKRESLPTDLLNTMFSFFDELERASREHKLNDEIHKKWLREMATMFQNLREGNSESPASKDLKEKNELHSSEQENVDPMNFLLFDDSSNISDLFDE